MPQYPRDNTYTYFIMCVPLSMRSRAFFVPIALCTHAFVIPRLSFRVLCPHANVVREPGGPTEHTPPPPPLPQEPSTMVPKCTLGCPEHNLTCSPDSHWDALELQPFAQGYPLAFTRALTERRSLMRHLNHLYIIIL